MNTHLHLMEAYSNLYSVWPDPKVAVRLKNLISTFTDKIIDPQTFHLKVFLDNKWFNAISASGTVSKGDKAGFWKCPYHNGRMCMEIIERVSKIEN